MKQGNGDSSEPDNIGILTAGPILLLLRRMERMELVFSCLVKRGLIKQEEIELANLKSTLNHAQRQIRVAENTNQDTEDLEKAAEVVRGEVKNLEQQLDIAV